MPELRLGSLTVEVTFGDIRNVHLSVHPPAGRVVIAAPRHMTLKAVRLFAVAKLAWVRRQQAAIRSQEREPPRESHTVWGRRRLLVIEEIDAAPSVELRHTKLVLRIRPGTALAGRAAVLEAWRRAQVRAAAAPVAVRWQAAMGVELAGFSVRRMRTRWGSCSPAARTIRLNTELARKPRDCLEYVVAQELAHLIEPGHVARFAAVLDRHMPGWRTRRDALNRLPLRHEEWPG